jgi:hypothetical protein
MFVYHLLIAVQFGLHGPGPGDISQQDGRKVFRIDRHWLDRRGPGPWVLDEPGTRYLLEIDVRAEGTAFVMAGPRQTLDLNGHTVTFNDAPPIAVPNGDFEDGVVGATSVRGWDLAGAPAATLIPNPGGLFGAKALRVRPPGARRAALSAGDPAVLSCERHGLSTGDEIILSGFSSQGVVNGRRRVTVIDPDTFSVPVAVTAVAVRGGRFARVQSVRSGAIALPEADRIYAASVTPSATRSGDNEYGIALDVLDAVTGLPVPVEVLPRGGSMASAGVSCSVVFRPETPGAVRVEIAVFGLVEHPAPVNLDRVILKRCYDYGVLATGKGGELEGLRNLPPSVWPLLGRCASPTVTSSVPGGKIVQGRHAGFRCSGVMASSVPGAVVIERIGVVATGDDARPIFASQEGTPRGPESRLIAGNTVEFRGTVNVTDRYEVFSAITAKNVHGPIAVVDNQVIDCPQCGITAGCSEGRRPGVNVLIVGNTVRVKKAVTNAYAIALGSGRGVKVIGNTVRTAPGSAPGEPGGGRGILIDALAGSVIDGLEIARNDVDVSEGPDRQYGITIPGRALRVRNIADAPRYGTVRNLDVHDNVFKSRTGAGLAAAMGARISLFNDSHAMDGAGIRFARNAYQGLADPGAAGSATALCLDGISSGVRPAFLGETYVSNDVALQIGGSDGGFETADTTLTLSTFARSGPSLARPFVAARAGYSGRPVRGVQILNPRYVGGAVPGIVWAGSGVKEIGVGRLLTLRARDVGVPAAAGASVRVVDRDGRPAFSGALDGAEELTVPLVTTVYRQCTGDHGVIDADERGPFTLLIASGPSGAVREVPLDLPSP